MKSSRRRSAFSVYQASSKKDSESFQKEEGTNLEPTEPKRRRCEENSSRKSEQKLGSSKSLSEDTNGTTDHEEHSPCIAESKHRGKGKLFSKANKLRQSLTFSSRRKKRNGYRSWDGDIAKSTSTIQIPADHEKPERTDSETGTDQAEDVNQGNDETEETEAEKLFAWLISPVKPKKFFRYCCSNVKQFTCTLESKFVPPFLLPGLLYN